MRNDCRSIGPVWGVTQATDTPGPSRSRQTLFYQFYSFITSPTILLSSAMLKLVLRTSARRSFNFLKCLRSSVLSTDSYPQIGTSNSCPNFLSPSAASDCLAPAPPIGLSGRSRASARYGPGTRAGPTWAGPGPKRDKPGHGVTMATPGGGDVTMGRDHRPPALPPGPLPNRVSLVGVRRCARAPTGVCQGPRALTQRSPRSGRFAAMRV